MATLTCRGTTIRIARGAVDSLNGGAGTHAIVTQPGARSIAEAVAQRLDAPVMVLPDREAAKTLGIAERVYRWLDEVDVDRHGTLVGIGGGTVTDLAGFVASTYLRGIRHVAIPTTLLAAVDAAIGGKTAVNLDAKNLVGTFWDPQEVLVDIDVLERLPMPVLREGMAEVVKAAMIGDLRLVGVLEAQGLDAPLDAVVPAAIEVKVAVVNEDPTEQGKRAILNYGHTAGHAIERAGSFSHGEAVSIGMNVAGTVSERLVGFGDTRRQRSLLIRLGLPTTARVSTEDVLDLMRHDKKRRGGVLRMVLLERIGSPVVVEVDVSTVRTALSDTLAEEVP